MDLKTNIQTQTQMLQGSTAGGRIIQNDNSANIANQEKILGAFGSAINTWAGKKMNEQNALDAQKARTEAIGSFKPLSQEDIRKGIANPEEILTLEGVKQNQLSYNNYVKEQQGDGFFDGVKDFFGFNDIKNRAFAEQQSVLMNASLADGLTTEMARNPDMQKMDPSKLAQITTKFSLNNLTGNPEVDSRRLEMFNNTSTAVMQLHGKLRAQDDFESMTNGFFLQNKSTVDVIKKNKGNFNDLKPAIVSNFSATLDGALGIMNIDNGHAYFENNISDHMDANPDVALEIYSSATEAIDTSKKLTPEKKYEFKKALTARMVSSIEKKDPAFAMMEQAQYASDYDSGMTAIEVQQALMNGDTQKATLLASQLADKNLNPTIKMIGGIDGNDKYLQPPKVHQEQVKNILDGAHYAIKKGASEAKDAEKARNLAEAVSAHYQYNQLVMTGDLAKAESFKQLNADKFSVQGGEVAYNKWTAENPQTMEKLLGLNGKIVKPGKEKDMAPVMGTYLVGAKSDEQITKGVGEWLKSTMNNLKSGKANSEVLSQINNLNDDYFNKVLDEAGLPSGYKSTLYQLRNGTMSSEKAYEFLNNTNEITKKSFDTIATISRDGGGIKAIETKLMKQMDKSMLSDATNISQGRFSTLLGFNGIGMPVTYKEGMTSIFQDPTMSATLIKNLTSYGVSDLDNVDPGLIKLAVDDTIKTGFPFKQVVNGKPVFNLLSMEKLSFTDAKGSKTSWVNAKQSSHDAYLNKNNIASKYDEFNANFNSDFNLKRFGALYALSTPQIKSRLTTERMKFPDMTDTEFNRYVVDKYMTIDQDVTIDFNLVRNNPDGLRRNTLPMLITFKDPSGVPIPVRLSVPMTSGGNVRTKGKGPVNSYTDYIMYNTYEAGDVVHKSKKPVDVITMR